MAVPDHSSTMDEDENSLSEAPLRSTRTLSQRIGPGLGNFSIQYNLSCASLALFVMDQKDHQGNIPTPAFADHLLLGAVFVGAIVGMLGFGFLGDVLGRWRAMMFTLSLTVIGALGSALLPWGSPNAIYGVIALCRFLLGAGVGGLYPLSATSSSESGDTSSPKARDEASLRAGWAFFWQAPGAMAPYLLGLLLSFMPNRPETISIQFRVILGVGALPALGVMVLTLWQMKHQDMVARRSQRHAESVSLASGASTDWRQSSSANDDSTAIDAAADAAHTASSLRSMFQRPEFLGALAGTAGSWFFYDIALYGTSVFVPDILVDIFGSHETLLEECWRSLIVTATWVPAILLTLYVLTRRSNRWLALAGFIGMACTFGMLATTYTAQRDGLATFKFILFSMVMFSINFGTNVATYVLPTEVFPAEIRSTCHGFSAASGKIGAAVGAFIYQPIVNAFGLATVMWLQAAFCIIGFLLCRHFVRPRSTIDADSDAAHINLRLLDRNATDL
eukprot:m.68958 g.68958  ORF g.68958 m.68958 type:complete len:506 (+) comp7784_c0_seq1:169-1686(+)